MNPACGDWGWVGQSPDENGNTLSDPKVMTGNIGDTYSFDTQDIEGYSLSSVSGPISGTYGNDDQTVTYVYKKNEPISITEDNPRSQNKNGSKPNDRQNLAKATTNMTNIGSTKTNTSKSFTNWSSSQLPEGKQSDELPITGMNKTEWLTLLGILIVLTSSFFIFKKNRQSK